MNDLNTHAHSDTLVIDADVCESHRELCGEYLNQLSRELDDVGLWDGQPTEYEEWQDVFDGDDYDHGQFDEEC